VKPATHSGGKFTTFQVISGMPNIVKRIILFPSKSDNISSETIFYKEEV